MMHKNTFSKKVLPVVLVLSIFVSSTMLFSPKYSYAQATVPVDTNLDFHSTQDYLKNFTLDKAAVMIANQILQKMTASIVGWVNSGFEGSPAFITNPKGFFLDAADQITGEFLDQMGGPLSQLCSPFSFDLRLNLALNQSSYATKRYTCTLGKIINNSRNAINTAGQNSGITISGDPNGATLGNFINGDFAQGGWEGYLAYSLEPQNNPIGATLMAQSDLQSRIAEKKSNINADLNRGQGFMSWQKCTDITDEYVSGDYAGQDLGLTNSQEQQLRQRGNQTAVTGRTDLGEGTSIQKKRDPSTGMISYQDCQTQTPGSLIGGSLQRQLNVPADKLVLVKTISDSIDAILGALVNQMLTQGLGALSNRGSNTSGGNKSYLVQLSEEASGANTSTNQNLQNQANNAQSSILNLAQNNAKIYAQTADLFIASKNNYIIAKDCFSAKLSTRPLLEDNLKQYAQDQMSAIDLIITRDIDPLISSTTIRKLISQRQVLDFQSSISSVNSFSTLDSAINSGNIATQAAINDASTAPQEYKAAQTKTTEFNTDAKKFQDLCAQFPDLTPINKTTNRRQ